MSNCTQSLIEPLNRFVPQRSNILSWPLRNVDLPSKRYTAGRRSIGKLKVKEKVLELGGDKPGRV